MYITTRHFDGGTSMTCKDCGHAIGMNEMCQKPIQAATDMLKHMVAHGKARAFTAVAPISRLEPQIAPPLELAIVGPTTLL